jgi:N-acetylglucosamine repressor
MGKQPHKATQQQTKTYNSRLVLKTIYDNGLISRADVARATHLTRTSVSDLVTELQEQGLVEEAGQARTIYETDRATPSRGRTPILLGVVPDGRHIIALDLANDEFRGAVVNLRNDILYSTTVRLAGSGGDEALDLIYDLVDNLLAWHPEGTRRPVLGIGIGTPGLVDSPNGVVVRAVNLEWQNLPLGRLLQERYKVPVYVANDSQVAALAVYMLESTGSSSDQSMVVIKIGHGISAGIILDGHLFHGDGGGAGEIGHVAVVDNGVRCRCGNIGCLETVVSDLAITRRARELSSSHTNSILNRLASNPGAITVDMVVQAARACDPAALEIVRETGRYLGIAAANLVGALDIRRILVLGNLAQLGEPLHQAIRQEMVKRALPMLAEKTRIELAPYNPDIVLLGASALLLTRELGLSLSR